MGQDGPLPIKQSTDFDFVKINIEGLRQMSRSNDFSKALTKAIRMTKNHPMVTGVDVGSAYKNGKKIRRLAIRFYVSKKLGQTHIPQEYMLPATIDGLPCDVIEANFVPLEIPEYYANFLQPGLSVGNVVQGTTGTAGPLVVDKKTGRIGLISCWHVLAGSTGASPGEGIAQPGVAHRHGGPLRIIADLVRSVPLNKGFDASLAFLRHDVDYDFRPWHWENKITGVERMRKNMRVFKVGAVTGETYGIVESNQVGNYRIPLNEYGAGETPLWGRKIIISDKTKEDELTREGDSGALWINEDTGKAVGLNFSGLDGGGRAIEHAVAHELLDVLNLLDVDLLLQ